MTHVEMWALSGFEGSYDAWSFGSDADALAQLVLKGVKTATASLRYAYELENCDLPKAGQYSVVQDAGEEAVCIIRTTKVYCTPFCEVTADHAWKEGEGDRSLSWWRKVHEAFFSEELRTAGMSFDPGMDVVCEEFELVFSV